MRTSEPDAAEFSHPSLLVHGSPAIRFRRWRKWWMIATYVCNVPRIRNHRHLGSDLGIRIACEDALLAAFSACHLVGMHFRQTRDSRMLDLLTKIWLAFVNFGDDVLDEYVGSRLSDDDTGRFAGRVYAASSPTQKAIVFGEMVDELLPEDHKCEIRERLLSHPAGTFQDSIVAVISFDREIDNCLTLEGAPLQDETKAAMRRCIARLFDICIRSYELERAVSRPCATVDEVLAIYRLKSLELQLAYGLIAEAYLADAPHSQERLQYAARARNYGAMEMMMSMFRDDVNDVHHDMTTQQPNLVVSLATLPGREAERRAIRDATSNGRPLTARSFPSLAPHTHAHFVRVREAEWHRSGVQRKPMFSYLLGVITDITTVGVRRAWENRRWVSLR